MTARVPHGQRIAVVRGHGRATPSTPSRFDGGDGAPAPLSVQQKIELVLGFQLVAVDQGPWEVRPDQPLLAGRADLVYHTAALVDLTQYDAPAAYFFSADDSPAGALASSLRVRFRPPRAGSYLVDCRVRDQGDTFTTTVFPGASKQTFAGTAHLVLLYEAVTTAQAEFHVSATHPQQKPWKFYGCEFTLMK